jgi:orotidine-5'-phosphate decarboxylase
MSKLSKKPGIIVALDIKDIDFALNLAKEMDKAKGNYALKIGRPLEMQGGKSIISKIKEVSNIPLIYDGKIADIPFISSEIAEIAYEAGADAVIMHSFVGSDVIKEIINLNMGDVITVVEMTHPGAVEYYQHYSEKMAEAALKLGVNGIVLPATRPERVKKLSKLISDSIYIISPGIKAQGAKPGDAIINGADYEVVGRAIYESEEPRKTAEALYQEIIERKRLTRNF